MFRGSYLALKHSVKSQFHKKTRWTNRPPAMAKKNDAGGGFARSFVCIVRLSEGYLCHKHTSTIRTN
ncbi:hypothetical protein Syun_003930 [Stephania yunnanensis]|uniref:Uncharacterized protein n=1 Tax=Stephania yunnanensis TaxID=152371 RepID=A0AAP0Q0P6_9MAGN